MKQKPITLRKFIETFPLRSFQEIVLKHIPDNFNELSYSQKFRFVGHSDEVLKVSVFNECIYVTVNRVVVHRVGSRIFKKSEKPHSSIFIEPNKITIKGGIWIVVYLLKHLNINWYRDIPSVIFNRFFIKPTILRAVLTKRIYNEETLYKRIGTTCYQLKNVGWRSIRDCLNCQSPQMNIFDLRDFTKNIEESIKAYKNASASDQRLYEDLLRYAAELNQVVDFTWSKKRIENEHRKQILSKREGDISDKSKEPIYNNVIGNDTIILLNTETDIFLEGTLMEHCLYRCYYPRIKNKHYVAFHMSYPEHCTFSVRSLANGEIQFDQIYLKRDYPVQEETRKIAKKFVEDNSAIIKEMFKEPVKQDEQKLEPTWEPLFDMAGPF